MQRIKKWNIKELVRLPTPEEVKRNTLSSWKAVEPVLLSRLHPEILRLTIPTKFVSVPTDEISQHWLPAFDTAEAGKLGAERLLAEAKAALNDFPGGFFFKLDSRSPKDTEIPRYTADKVHDLPGAVFNSERMLDDLCAQRYHRDNFVLCFREWTEMRDEQRVFVRDGAIQGITRYDYREEPPIEYTPDHIAHIERDAAEYLAAIHLHMPITHYVFDFGYLPSGETILIELNPYGLSDPCCFGSYDKIAGYAWKANE